MQRPVMQPTFSADDITPKKKKTPQWQSFFKNNVLSFLKWCVKSLLSNPVKLKRRAEVTDKPPLVSRMIRGLAYRARRVACTQASATAVRGGLYSLNTSRHSA